MYMEGKKLLSVAQLAAEFGIARVHIRNMVINNSIPFIMIDKKPYFSLEQIIEWREELIKERYDIPIFTKSSESEQLEYYQHFTCTLCEYVGKVAVYNDNTVYEIVENIKKCHADNSPECTNDIQDITITMEVVREATENIKKCRADNSPAGDGSRIVEIE